MEVQITNEDGAESMDVRDVLLQNDSESRENEQKNYTEPGSSLNKIGEDNSSHLTIINNGRSKWNIIEPAIFLIFMTASMFGTVITNVIESQFCRVNLNTSEEECFSQTSVHKIEIQKYTTILSMIRQVIEVLIPSILSLFVGPWSDTYGRKPLMLSGYVGYVLTYGLWVLMSTIDWISPNYYVLNSFSLAFSGGLTIILLSTYCYICDVTSVDKLAFRLGVFQTSLFLGTLAGALACPVLLPGGYTLIFAVAFGLAIISALYTYFFVDESVVSTEIRRSTASTNPLNLDHIRDMFAACYTRRSPKVRLAILLLLMTILCSSTSAYGESEIIYLFLQHTFGWDIYMYTQLNVFIISVNAVVAFGGIWLFSSVLKFHDLLILSVAALLRVLSAFIIVVGYENWHIYFSRLLASSLGLTSSLVRSFLSRLIPSDELGKVFSLIGSAESAMPFVAAILYSMTYTSVIEIFPQGVFFVSAVLLLIMLILLTIVVKIYVKPEHLTAQQELKTN